MRCQLSRSGPRILLAPPPPPATNEIIAGATANGCEAALSASKPRCNRAGVGEPHFRLADFKRGLSVTRLVLVFSDRIGERDPVGI
jgi:hypothetical protein